MDQSIPLDHFDPSANAPFSVSILETLARKLHQGLHYSSPDMGDAGRRLSVAGIPAESGGHLSS